MNASYLEILKNIKVNDLTLGIISFINLIYPAFITWYIFDIEFLIETDKFTLILLSVSIGFIFNIITFGNLTFQKLFTKKDFTFEDIKSIVPVLIVYQSITFFLIIISVFPLIIAYSLDYHVNSQLKLYYIILAYFYYSIIDCFYKRRKLNKTK